MFCKNCGKEINENAVVCIGCGCAVDEPKKSATKGSANSLTLFEKLEKVFLTISIIAFVMSLICYVSCFVSYVFFHIPFIVLNVLTFIAGGISIVFSVINIKNNNTSHLTWSITLPALSLFLFMLSLFIFGI